MAIDHLKFNSQDFWPIKTGASSATLNGQTWYRIGQKIKIPAGTKAWTIGGSYITYGNQNVQSEETSYESITQDSTATVTGIVSYPTPGSDLKTSVLSYSFTGGYHTSIAKTDTFQHATDFWLVPCDAVAAVGGGK